MKIKRITLEVLIEFDLNALWVTSVVARGIPRYDAERYARLVANLEGGTLYAYRELPNGL